MSKIKIISNPYLKETIIQKWSFSEETWGDLSLENSSQSILISEDIKTSFFQFKADEIVAGIFADYHNPDEKISIVFEGTEDDYVVLEKICAREEYQNDIVLIQSERHLENASDILPAIKKIFSQLEPLVEYCVSDKEDVRRDMNKFSDASDDYIPVVIIGNYSSGKSTFINSLLGTELLPSGDEPVTAKIYKIIQSDTEDRASLSFYFHDVQKVEVFFTTKKYRIECKEDNIIVKKLKEAIDTVKNESITTRLSKALLTINSYENDTEDQEISDLIEVSTPFNSGVIADSEAKYVIFDTPGSNSASNGRHLDVLQRAMEDMSNGVPLFVAGVDSLDSTDNESLYTRIKSMPELDTRFTMIIVNKADSSSLPSEGFTPIKIKNILNESVPKNLYSQGIYYVSSIMGLGSKIGEELEDEHYSEIFDTQYRNYSNPNSKHYKTLYKYNIMPGQIKLDCIESAMKCDDLIYANSGIYSVELGLESFAKKYSPYNKCEQSRLFLKKTIDTTERVIAEKVEKSTRDKANMIQTLEKEKAELLEKIQDESERLDNIFTKRYRDFIDDYIHESWKFISSEDLKIQEKNIEIKYQDELRLGDYDAKVKDSKNAVANSIKNGISNKDISRKSLARLGKHFLDSLSELQTSRAEFKNTSKRIDEKVSDELLERNKDSFVEFASAQKESIDGESRAFWAEKANQVRTELSEIISGTAALTEEQRNTLSDIIIHYGDIVFDSKVDEIFIKDDFVYGIRFGKIVIGDVGKLRLDKLKRTFNSELNKYINNICKQIQVNHENSFKSWLNALLSDIRDNITEYSSMLKTQLDYIKKEEEVIVDFENKQRLIKNYTEEIEEMISWKE